MPIPRLYINGFLLAQSQSDVTMVALANGSPNSVINMSFTTAKSLMVELQKVVENLETSTNHEIMTMQDVSTRQGAGGQRS